MRKRQLNDFQIQEALSMRDKNFGLGQIARHFGTNKPQLLKSLHLWDEVEQKMPDGKRYIISRGKPTIMPEKEESKDE